MGRTDISKAVGAWSRGASNRREDVVVVQELLKEAARTQKEPLYDPGTVDGLISTPPRASRTVNAILAFQKQVMRFPDGIVEPGKLTLRRLQAFAPVPPPVPPPPPPSSPLPVGPTPLKIAFPGTRIALIVRGKRSPSHEPGVMDQHADCILPNGAPVGFFGDMPGGPSGMGLTGVVADYAWFSAHRPYYVNLATAKGYGAVSTLLTVEVSAVQAGLFASYWSAAALSPGDFYILGKNCSTVASDSFVSSGILAGGIPGLDTPNSLYNQLVAVKGAAAKSYSGYLGFSPASGAFTVEVLV